MTTSTKPDTRALPPSLPTTNASASDSTTSARPIRIIRIRQVLELVGLKKTAVYDLRQKGDFPRPVRITGRAIGWVEEEVHRWIAERRDRERNP
jgi:prophage regulatory protein